MTPADQMLAAGLFCGAFAAAAGAGFVAALLRRLVAG